MFGVYILVENKKGNEPTTLYIINTKDEYI